MIGVGQAGWRTAVIERRGLMKALVAAESDEILGCAVLGVLGGELMALRDGVFAHPALAESLNTLFSKAEFGVDESPVTSMT